RSNSTLPPVSGAPRASVPNGLAGLVPPRSPCKSRTSERKNERTAAIPGSYSRGRRIPLGGAVSGGDRRRRPCGSRRRPVEPGGLVGIGLVERLVLQQRVRERLQTLAVVPQARQRAGVALVHDPADLPVHQLAGGLRRAVDAREEGRLLAGPRQDRHEA